MIRTRMTCQCNECATTLTDGFTLAARMSLERLSMEAVSSLQEEVHINKKYITVVREVMSLLKVTPQSILERSMYRRERRCCNSDCPELKAGLRPVKKYTCTGCHTVLYCGSDCQKGCVSLTFYSFLHAN
ncbi:hypothetical protein BDN70DRAFT_84742 [Pholiota conissans]|uniref:Uncharacterized protein n=1 Tax=Pholiota conissans TaxID=109636 RepID=A0A9P5ZD23_9AGAR|nr:hypothetical protein BDN70DRAFT_84742 [Pholiota conissans]